MLTFFGGMVSAVIKNKPGSLLYQALILLQLFAYPFWNGRKRFIDLGYIPAAAKSQV
jgi:hypothetical protein